MRIRAFFGSCSAFQVILWAILASLPFISLLLLSAVSGNNCFEAMPLWSDELDYWREVYSFSALEPFGYYGFVGHDPSVWTAGCHGLAPFFVYGLPSIIFGWGYSSIVLWNAVYCSAALVVLVVVLRPNPKMGAYIAALWFLYPAIQRYIPTSMMEMPHYALIIVYATLIIHAVRCRRLTRLSFVVLILIVLMMISLRINELVFFFPILALVLFYKGKRHCALCAVSLLLLVVAFYLIQGVFTAAYPYGFLFSVGMQETLVGKLSMLGKNLTGNIANFFSFDEGLLQTSQRYAYFVSMIGLVVLLVVLALRHRAASFGGGSINRLLVYLAVAFLCMLGASFFFVAVFYDIFDWRDYRTLSPILWSQLLLFAMLASMKAGEAWEGVRRILSKCGLCTLVIACLLSACSRVGFGTQAAFEESRFANSLEIEALDQERIDLQVVKPLGVGTDLRTAVTLLGAMPYGYWFALDPEIGISASTNEDEALASGAAYIFSNKVIENPGPYELLLDDGSCFTYRLVI